MSNKIRLINVGRYVDQKDQITILKAVNEIKNKVKIELIIMGRGVDKKKLEQYIIRNQLKHIAKLIDFQKNPYPFIKKSDIFILSSKYEGLPNVLLEALVLNKFIISSDCPTGPKEILDSGKGGHLFNVGDYKSLSKIILKFKKNKRRFILKNKFAQSRLYRFDYRKNMNKYYLIVRKYVQ